MSSRNIS